MWFMKNFTCKSVNWPENNFQILIKANCKTILKYTELSDVLNSILILLITNAVKVCIFRQESSSEWNQNMYTSNSSKATK